MLESFIEPSHDLDSECNITIRELLGIVRKAVNVELLPITEKIDNISTQLTQLKTDVADNGAKIMQLQVESESSKTNLTKVESEVDILKKVILKQQEFLEMKQRQDLEGNVVVRGIPKGKLIIPGAAAGTELKTTSEKTFAILEFIGCACEETDFELIELPSNDDYDTLITKLKFSNREKLKLILANSMKLKNLPHNKIFIKKDEPYHTRKENGRLRKKRYDLSQLHPLDEIKIEKGKLFHNRMVVDKFDLNNQIF